MSGNLITLHHITHRAPSASSDNVVIAYAAAQP